MSKGFQNKKNILKSNNLKITGPRLNVLNLFGSSPLPLNAELIYKKLSKKIKIDLATVYRILSLLKSKNIIKEVNLGGKSAHYELSGEERHHHHITCLKCRKIRDFNVCDYKNLAKNISKELPEFKEIKNHSFELSGFCNTCIKRTRS